MMQWEQTTHCSWDANDMRIVKQFCPKMGGVVFKLFNGANVKHFASLAEAQAAAVVKELF